MQFLRSQLPDFENSWSCLILTLLRIEQCTMYPPHFNYTATLPCGCIIEHYNTNAENEIKCVVISWRVWHTVEPFVSRTAGWGVTSPTASVDLVTFRSSCPQSGAMSPAKLSSNSSNTWSVDVLLQSSLVASKGCTKWSDLNWNVRSLSSVTLRCTDRRKRTNSFIIHSFLYCQQMSKRIRRYIWLKHITIMLLGK